MKIDDLLPKLLETTRRNKITWSQAMDTMFIARIGDRKFQINQALDEDSDELYFRFNIYVGKNDAPYEGRFIDGMVADRFKGPFSELEEVYNEARRNALGLEEVISNIDDELGKLLI